MLPRQEEIPEVVILIVERRELLHLANRLVQLLMSQDTSDLDLIQMMENQQDELRAFHDEVFSLFTIARHGAQFITDIYRNDYRMNNFVKDVALLITENLNQACLSHFKQNLVYYYDAESNAILMRERITHSPNPACLCGSQTEQERLILGRPFNIPNSYLNQPDLIIQLEINRNRVETTELSTYHIIPLHLAFR